MRPPRDTPTPSFVAPPRGDRRETDKLRIEMERRHSESLRRETMMQRARDEVAAAAAKQEREAATLLARTRDEDAMRAPR